MVICLSLLLLTERKLLYAFTERFRPSPAYFGQALILGSPEHAAAFMHSETHRTQLQLNIVGFVSTDRVEAHSSLGVISELEWVIEQYDIDTIFLAEQIENELLVETGLRTNEPNTDPAGRTGVPCTIRIPAAAAP